MPLLTRLRLARGLHWRTSLPSIDWSAIGILLAILCAYGIVGSVDYEDELRQQAEAQRVRADLNIAALLACMNGKAPGFYLEGQDGTRTYLVCGQPWELPVGKVAS